jgi:hypothetical protein
METIGKPKVSGSLGRVWLTPAEGPPPFGPSEVAPPKRKLRPSEVILSIKDASISGSGVEAAVVGLALSGSGVKVAGVGFALAFLVGGGSDLSSAGPADRSLRSEVWEHAVCVPSFVDWCCGCCSRRVPVAVGPVLG